MMKNKHSEFEKIFIRYYEKIKLFSFKLLKSEIEAEDIAQEVFLKLYQQGEMLNKIDNIEAYLYRITRNTICNYIKHLYVERRYIETVSDEEVFSDGYEIIYENELLKKVNFFVEALPPQRKLVFQMSREEGLSNSEISQQLNISKRTVDNHIYLTLSDLKKILSFFIF